MQFIISVWAEVIARYNKHILSTLETDVIREISSTILKWGHVLVKQIIESHIDYGEMYV